MANLQTSTAALREGGGEHLISSTLTDSAITEARERGGKKSGHCHSRSLSSFNSLYKSHKRKASQNDVAKKEEKTSEMEYTTLVLN